MRLFTKIILLLILTAFVNAQHKVEIVVSDNGNGIAQTIIDKIFQPFFTTKPSGQGTVLGLSLSYDIITKEHNGTVKVKVKKVRVQFLQFKYQSLHNENAYL